MTFVKDGKLDFVPVLVANLLNIFLMVSSWQGLPYWKLLRVSPLAKVTQSFWLTFVDFCFENILCANDLARTLSLEKPVVHLQQGGVTGLDQVSPPCRDDDLKDNVEFSPTFPGFSIHQASSVFNVSSDSLSIINTNSLHFSVYTKLKKN